MRRRLSGTCRFVDQSRSNDTKLSRNHERRYYENHVPNDRSKFDQDARTVRPFSEIPGPKPLPILGNFWRFLPLIGSYPRDNQLLLIQKLHRRYGNIVKLSGIPGKPDIIMTFDPKDFEKVFRTEGTWPKRDAMPSYKHYRHHVRCEFFDGIGSMVTEQGKKWWSIRNIANNPMLNPKIMAKYIDPINEVATDFVKRMSELRNSNETLPESFNRELNKWALESIALLALDTRLGCFNEDSRDIDTQRLVDAVVTMMSLTYELDVCPSPLSFLSRKKFNEAVDVQIDITMKYMERCMNRSKRNDIDGNRTRSVLEELLATTDRTIACSIATDMIHAGIDTTARTVENVLLHLSLPKNEKAQKSLRAELTKVLPEVDSPVNQSDLANLPYLKACIKESMRITPTAIGSVRQAGRDLALSGYKIPEGTTVVMYHVTATNCPDEFADPTKYLPERWIRDLTKIPNDQRDAVMPAKNAHPFSFLPFGFGPRACIGQRFANTEMEILIAKIFRRWKVVLERDYKFQSKLFYGLATPLTLRLIDA